MRPATTALAWRRLALLAIAVIALDQLTKALARDGIDPGERVDLFPGVDLVHVLNEGVAFGFLGGSGQGVVLAVTLIAFAGVLAWFSREPRRPGVWIAVGALAGGAVGNAIDRVREDGVTDFIDLPAWPAFNVADIAITLGAAALVLIALASAGAEAAPDER